jgi:hypothetical protein
MEATYAPYYFFGRAGPPSFILEILPKPAFRYLIGFITMQEA